MASSRKMRLKEHLVVPAVTDPPGELTYITMSCVVNILKRCSVELKESCVKRKQKDVVKSLENSFRIKSYTEKGCSKKSHKHMSKEKQSRIDKTIAASVYSFLFNKSSVLFIKVKLIKGQASYRQWHKGCRLHQSIRIDQAKEKERQNFHVFPRLNFLQTSLIWFMHNWATVAQQASSSK